MSRPEHQLAAGRAKRLECRRELALEPERQPVDDRAVRLEGESDRAGDASTQAAGIVRFDCQPTRTVRPEESRTRVGSHHLDAGRQLEGVWMGDPETISEVASGSVRTSRPVIASARLR